MLTMIPGALEKQSCPFSRLETLRVAGNGSSNNSNIPAKVMAYFLTDYTSTTTGICDGRPFLNQI